MKQFYFNKVKQSKISMEQSESHVEQSKYPVKQCEKSVGKPYPGAKLGLIMALIIGFAIFSSVTSAYTDYPIKRMINLTVPSGTTPANYQVLLNVTYDLNMRNDYGDIIFTNENESVKFDYYLYYNSSQYAYFWVKIDQPLSTSNLTIYMHFGNSSKTTESNGTNTFIVFDDFEDGNINGWVNDVNNACSYSSDSSGKYLKLAYDGFCNFTYSVVPVNNFIMEYDTRRELGGLSGGYGSGIRLTKNSTTYRYLSWIEYYINDILLAANNNGFSGWLSLTSNAKTLLTTLNNWYHIRTLKFDSGKNTTVLTSNGYKNVSQMEYEGFVYDNRLEDGAPGYLEARVYQTLNVTMDNIFVREYGPDPIVDFDESLIVNFISPTDVNGSEAEGKSYITWNMSVSSNPESGLFQINGTNHSATCTSDYCYFNETGFTTNQTRCALGYADYEDKNNVTEQYICRNLVFMVYPNPENYTGTGITIQLTPDSDAPIVNMTCMNPNTLFVERSKFHQIDLLNGSIYGYYYNTTEEIYCSNGCYEDIFSNGAACAPPLWQIAILGILIMLCGIWIIRFIWGRRR